VQQEDGENVNIVIAGRGQGGVGDFFTSLEADDAGADADQSVHQTENSLQRKKSQPLAI